MSIAKIATLLVGCAAVALELIAGSGGTVVNVTGLLTVAGVIAV